jgi:nitrile hydratase
MNGIHDMGGMDGFGAVTPELNEPVFHADWESRVLGLVNTMMRSAGVNIDEFRHAIERIPPARYLASSYYERWLAAVETLLLEHGIVTREELKALPAPERAEEQEPAKPTASAAKPRARARFKPGDRVRVRNANPAGHTRAPRYVRDKCGIVRRDHGIYVLADSNAHHAGEKRQHVYSVEFTARELWGRNDREKVLIDLWEDYLESERPHPPAATRAKKRTRRVAPSSPVKRTREGRRRGR